MKEIIILVVVCLAVFVAHNSLHLQDIHFTIQASDER